jgi:rod shape determining protein RodA
MFGLIFIPRKFIYSISFWLYIVSIILLILPLLTGHSSDSRRWINLHFFQFQPSEFAKLSLIMALAAVFSIKNQIVSHIKELVLPTILTLILFLLVLIEPDLGTALVFPAIFIFILLVKGIKLKIFFFIVTPILSLLTAFHWISWICFIIILIIFLLLYKQGFAYSFSLFVTNSVVGTITPVVWNHLKLYQRQRIISFFNPGADPRGAGWHILQSKIAVGSGGLFGKGFLQGTQNKLLFLPEQHTDFIFSVVGEEWGFVGAFIILTLFLLLLSRIIIIMRGTRSYWGTLLLAGVETYFAFQIFLNIGMCINILPVAGIPLPLMSYGGSQTILSYVLIGLVLNTGYNRYDY